MVSEFHKVGVAQEMSLTIVDVPAMTVALDLYYFTTSERLEFGSRIIVVGDVLTGVDGKKEHYGASNWRFVVFVIAQSESLVN